MKLSLPHNNFSLSLFFSLIIHFLVFICLWNTSIFQEHSLKKFIPKEKRVTIEIKKIPKIKLSSQQTTHEKTKNISNLKKFKDIRPSISLEELSLDQQSSKFLVIGLDRIKDDIGKFDDQMGVSSQLNEGGHSIYYYLHQYIGQNLYYPKIFRDKGIEGFVKIRLVFDKKGNYLHHLTKIQSNSGYLKVLVARILKNIFEHPLPFDLSFVKHPYFLVDVTFRFNAKSDDTKDFILANTYVNGRHLGLLIQDDSVSNIGFRKNNEGLVKLSFNYQNIIDWFKSNYTTAGKLKKQFQIRQFETYQDDPDWED